MSLPTGWPAPGTVGWRRGGIPRDWSCPPGSAVRFLVTVVPFLVIKLPDVEWLGGIAAMVNKNQNSL